MNDAYSETWFRTFLDTIDPAQTLHEAKFVARRLPLPRHRRVLDICCGPGRHAAALTSMGFAVTGFDCNVAAIDRARVCVPTGATFFVHDVRQTVSIPGEFDAAILLWQSFGQFEEMVNLDVLRQIGTKVVPAGRFILDIYHPGFFGPRQGKLKHERAGRIITETKSVHGNRLSVHLKY